MSSGRDDLMHYLDDHRSGAAGGTALARRLADRIGDEPGFEPMVGIAREIEEDRQALDVIRRHVGADGGIRRLLATTAEHISELVLGALTPGSSRLTLVLELEALMAGVAGKRSGWESLRVFAGGDELAGVDLVELERRADEQIERLGRLHALAADRAFGASST